MAKSRTALGLRIRVERHRKNLLQAELGELLNVTSTAVSEWELGNKTPSLRSLRALANIFGCTLDDLVGGDEIAFTDPAAPQDRVISSERESVA